jgi:hypothetical protein
MENYKTTPNNKLTHSQLLELRNLDENQMDKLIEIYGSCIYEVLFRECVIGFEINDEYDLFITHKFELFNDYEFEILVDSFENDSECIDRDQCVYETQVIAD